jgi:ABC-type multidrug transport system permease subunit
LRSILLKGEGVAVFWQQFVFMMIFAFAVLAIATRRYIKKAV